VALVLAGPTVDPDARSLLGQGARLVRDVAHEPLSLDWLVATDYVRSGPLRTLRWAQQMLAHRIEDRLPHVEAPTLVVRGERDPIVPRRWAEHAAQLVPGGELVEIAGAPHAAHYTHPPSRFGCS
jgi:pimeloyl-ACP methyl ester carboxylesterase